ncbi:MAG: type IV pilus assembly protein PilM [Candidatus Cloacimonetes bacterium]|nr:type IV pilus assembly protein PilM [Candidatus Cloacimonadota bacterium]
MAKKKKTKFRESIGLDIGSHSIKMVHLKKQHDGFRLLNYDIRSTVPAGVEYTPSDLTPDRYAPIISGMLRNMKINPKKVRHLVSSIGGDNTSIKQIRTIFLPDEELESALFFEAKKHLPISGAEMILDYQVLSVEEKTNNMNILLAATTKELLNEHSTILTDAGLAPGIVDIESLAVANSFSLNAFVEEGVYIILNIGAHKTNMILYGPQSKFFTRDIPWGGYNFTKDIIRERGLSYEEAEVFKREHGLIKEEVVKEDGAKITLDITEKSTAEHIAMEVKRSLRFYVKEAGNSDFRKIFLVGGTAKMPGLPVYFTEQLNIPTEIFNPCVNLDISDRSKITQDPQLALAVGLAMRPE